jgi:hypothetical protein
LEAGNNKSFQFKYADEKNRPQSKDRSGYRADINELTANNMTITVPSNYEGKSFNVVMKFEKKSDNINL